MKKNKRKSFQEIWLTQFLYFCGDVGFCCIRRTISTMVMMLLMLLYGFIIWYAETVAVIDVIIITIMIGTIVTATIIMA